MTVVVVVFLTVMVEIGAHGWLLAQAGMTYGDEMEANIPLETQGQVFASLVPLPLTLLPSWVISAIVSC